MSHNAAQTHKFMKPQHPGDFPPSGCLPTVQTARMSVACRMAPVLMVLAGCSLMQTDRGQTAADTKPPPVVPDRIIASWNDTVLHQPGEPGIRGFGGRVMFYGEDADKPLQVDGAVIVYAWLEAGASESQRVPDRKYVFTADQLAQHYSRSRLGHSYSFWLPWEQAGGPHRRVTLITRFVGRHGGEAISSSARSVLPGPSSNETISTQPTDAAAAAKSQPKTQPSADDPNHANPEWAQPQVDSESQPAVEHASEMTTSTIDVPDGFAKRNLNSRGTIDANASISSGSKVARDTFDSSNRSAEQQRDANISRSRPAPKTSLEQPASMSEDANASESTDVLNRTPQPAAQSSGAITHRESATRFVRGRFPDQTAPSAPPSTGGVRRQPLPAKSQRGLPPTPRSHRTVTPR